MKKLFLILAACAIAAAPLSGVSAQAKIKVVDSSAKKAPVWVGGTQSEYIITSGTATTLERAKQDAMEAVRRQIARSVAENVEATSTGTIDQTIMNSEIVSFLDTYSSTYKTQAADVPFLTGVSESKVEDYYWEKRQNKSTGEITWVYSVKYPFPSLELKKLVNDFNKRDAAMWQSYKDWEERYATVNSLEEIDRGISELGRLADYFFDNTRKNAAKGLQKSYRDLYNAVSFKTVSNRLGEYRFKLLIDGRDVTTSQRMTAKSQDETRFDIEHDGADIVVSYNVAGAEYDVENTVTVNLKIGGKTVPHKFAYTARRPGKKLWPDKTAYLTAGVVTDSLMTNIDVRMDIVSPNGGQYTLNSVMLEVPGMSKPLCFDNLNMKIDRKEQQLVFTYIGDVEPAATQYGKLNMLRGYLIVDDGSGDARIDFSLPFKANW